MRKSQHKRVIEMENETENKASEKAKRLKNIRKKLDLSRQQFAVKFNLTKSSVQNWEDGKFSGLTVKGAIQLVQQLSRFNIMVTLDWLMKGRGTPPIFPKNVKDGAEDGISSTEWSSRQTIQKELMHFHKLNKGCIDFILHDDALMPLLKRGDFVAGKRFFETDFSQALDRLCIVQLDSGETLARIVAKTPKPQIFDLLTLNNKITHTDIKIFSVAPVVWMRRIF